MPKKNHSTQAKLATTHTEEGYDTKIVLVPILTYVLPGQVKLNSNSITSYGGCKQKTQVTPPY